MRHAEGFSLLEMLVALAVFGLVVLALLNLAGESTRTAAIVEERMLAGVVADNRAVEAAIEPLPVLAHADAGSERVGGREWRWTRSIDTTDDPGIVRVAIAVRPADAERVVAEATVFRSAL